MATLDRRLRLATATIQRLARQGCPRCCCRVPPSIVHMMEKHDPIVLREFDRGSMSRRLPVAVQVAVEQGFETLPSFVVFVWKEEVAVVVLLPLLLLLLLVTK